MHLGYIYKINGVPRNQPAGKYVVTEASGESSGINKSRLDIAKLQPEYNYSIELYAKTSAGQGMEPAKINASTISFDAARPLVPVQVNVTQLLGVVNISWSYDEKSQFLPDNYTLLVRLTRYCSSNLFCILVPHERSTKPIRLDN